MEAKELPWSAGVLAGQIVEHPRFKELDATERAFALAFREKVDGGDAGVIWSQAAVDWLLFVWNRLYRDLAGPLPNPRGFVRILRRPWNR